MDIKVVVNIPDLFDRTIDNVVYLNMGLRGVSYIRKRVQEGKYLPGSTGGSGYSTKPMPVPYGAMISLVGKSAIKEYKVYRSKTGKTMVILTGGYKKWRQMHSKADNPVTMHWSSRMMRNLGIIRQDENAVWLGFSSAEEQQKADWQHQGAGKNRITRLFMDFTEEEQGGLADLAEEMIMKQNEFEG